MEPPAFVLASERLSLAFFVAREAHAGQTRGGGGRPYLDHPIQVAELLNEAGCREETIAAGLLHDAVEDSGLTVGDVVESFGVEVGELRLREELGAFEAQRDRAGAARSEPPADVGQERAAGG